jgi:hypothetical protein
MIYSKQRKVAFVQDSDKLQRFQLNEHDWVPLNSPLVIGCFPYSCVFSDASENFLFIAGSHAGRAIFCDLRCESTPKVENLPSDLSDIKNEHKMTTMKSRLDGYVYCSGASQYLEAWDVRNISKPLFTLRNSQRSVGLSQSYLFLGDSEQGGIEVRNRFTGEFITRLVHSPHGLVRDIRVSSSDRVYACGYSGAQASKFSLPIRLLRLPSGLEIFNIIFHSMATQYIRTVHKWVEKELGCTRNPISCDSCEFE